MSNMFFHVQARRAVGFALVHLWLLHLRTRVLSAEMPEVVVADFCSMAASTTHKQSS